MFVGESLKWTGGKSSFMTALEQTMLTLEAEGSRPAWD
ncbi:protein of unknown function [Candidatus Nitrospira inopinata]|jgi:hypothetical protein|uniref:Uncharacterized protein n=1 Tax=Candidatus Nitrospira inopinata TaxID=1715989 RepID=A0A0S4KUM8_9BACT|nr:protein of unknown function [Candidatus Nitrospira inopinata]